MVIWLIIMTKQNILVTGGLGFIGKNLVSHLLDKGYYVSVVDVREPTDLLNLPNGVIFNRIDVNDFESMVGFLKSNEIDSVVHLAAQVSVEKSIGKPLVDFSANVMGTLNLLEACRQAEVPRVVYASTAAVYGNPVNVPLTESDETIPISPYGVSKLTAEKYVMLYNSLYGFENSSLRLFNVYGPGQDPHSPYSGVISKFINWAARGETLMVLGDGNQTRDFVFVEDVCNAFELALSKNKKDIFNIGSGTPISINELAKAVIELSHSDSKVVHEAPREGDILHSLSDISKAKKHLNFSPAFDIQQGLRKTVDW